MARTARTLTISLPRELARKIDRLAKKEGRTRSELFRAAIGQYIDRRERWERIFEYAGQQADRLGITTKEVPRLVKEYRHERRAT